MRSPFWFIGGITGFLASLSCLIPVLLLVFGFLTVSSALALGNLLFFQYWWAFLSGGIILASFITYFYAKRKKGVCTRHDILAAIFIFLLAYLIFELIWEVFWVKLGFYKK